VAVTKEITRLEKSNVRLSLTVPRDDVYAAYLELLREYTKNIQLPGFRKGKVPREVLERKFGEGLASEAAGRVIEKTLDAVLDDPGLARGERPLPYSTPELDGKPEINLETDLHFSVVYDVLPVVQVGQWKGLVVEAPCAEISEEDIARELETIRERNTIVLDRNDGDAAQNGDVVTVHYCEIDEAGEEVPNSRRDDFVFALGTGQNLYRFDDEVTGMKKGETKEFTKTFPADFGHSPLAGQTKKIRVTLTALKEKKIPDLDDDLAQDVDEEFSTLDDLKNSIRERLSENLERHLRSIKINLLLEKIMETTPVVLPESMVRVEMEGRLRGLARRFNTDTETMLRMFMRDGNNLDDIEQDLRPPAEKALHSRLIIETLMEEQKIEASDEDMEHKFEIMAAESGSSIEDVKKHFGNDAIQEELRDDIKEQKLLDMLLAENTIKPGKKEQYLDLMGNNG
jgi:trigger factor